jgi:hypothetical protein
VTHFGALNLSCKLHKTKNISQTLRHNGRMTFIIQYKSVLFGKQITEVFELNSKKNNNNFINSYFLNFTLNFVLLLLFLAISTLKILKCLLSIFTLALFQVMVLLHVHIPFYPNTILDQFLQ